ncbi:MAG: dihydrofolate reductase family protein [Anaerolineae bacterium]|nr:dihydrofolate reductase family protein [Anaerolineae bacterium]
MGQVITQFTMSLDGFIAGPNDEVWPLLNWYMSGDTEFTAATADRAFKVSRASANLLREEWAGIGAIVTGRRDFDVSAAWGGSSPMNVPCFIVTHTPPHEWLKEGSPFTFITDGVARAIALAKEAAGEKHVAVSGRKIVQQCLLAGLVDKIHIDLAPLLLGEGIRLFDNLGSRPISLENTKVVEGTGVAHLRFRIIK